MTLKTVRMGLLFDYYGQLLTERQQSFFSHYYNDDLSLGEIADQYGVSRQAVYDILRRSTHALEEYDSKLQLIERSQKQEEYLDKIQAEIQNAIDLLAQEAPARLIAKVLQDALKVTELAKREVL